MAENKFVLKELSTYTGKTNILYQKEFESREQAEKYRDIIEPLLRETQAKKSCPSVCKAHNRRALMLHVPGHDIKPP